MRFYATIITGVLLVFTLAPAVSAQPEETTVSVSARETALTDVLAILADKSGLNIVTSPAVEGKVVSVHIRNTPIDEALDLVVRAAGLAYERIGDSILVGDAETLAEETGLDSYVLDIMFADAHELEPLIGEIAESASTDPGGNRLIVVASPGKIEQIRRVVKKLDVPPAQIMLVTEVIEVTTDDLMEYGIDWSKLMSQTVLFAEGSPEPSAPDGLPEEMLWDVVHFDVDDIARQAQTLEMAIDFLEGEGKARILSRSQLATLNNRQAEIHIGDVIPYTVSGVSSAGAVEVTVEREKVGVTVSVTPRATGDGHITVLVEPNVSSIVGWKGPNEEIPWTKERRTSTQVRVRDGQTFIIAGLLNEDTSTEDIKVPFLGDIPIIGYLFKHVKNSVKTSDLIIKITPTIIS
jgi:type II secretory pathway component GspD/PulD (secretin)